eukprot:6503023-Prymnesium_polylepis.1
MAALRRTPSTRRQRTRCKSYPLSVAADTGSAQTRERSARRGKITPATALLVRVRPSPVCVRPWPVRVRPSP